MYALLSLKRKTIDAEKILQNVRNVSLYKMLAIIVNTAKIFAKLQPLSEKYLMSVTDVKTY